MELEKRYWLLKGQSRTGKLDLETLVPLISPPVPLSVCPGVFGAFDENRDSHIDFKEMACGISAACRGPLTERQKCMLWYCNLIDFTYLHQCFLVTVVLHCISCCNFIVTFMYKNKVPQVLVIDTSSLFCFYSLCYSAWQSSLSISVLMMCHAYFFVVFLHYFCK